MATFAYHSLPNLPGAALQSPDAPSLPSFWRKARIRITEKLTTRSLALWITASIFLLVTPVGIIILLQHTSPSTPHPSQREECGISPSEALSKGCIFDPILMGWVPWRCHNAPLAQQFLTQASNSSFYRSPDKSPSDLLKIEEVVSGTWNSIYVDPEFYIIQCLYTWKKTWRAALDGSPLDGYLADEHHTNHCDMLITLGPEREKSLYMKYVSCSAVHYDSGRFGWYRIIDGRRVYRTEG